MGRAQNIMYNVKYNNLGRIVVLIAVILSKKEILKGGPGFK